MATRLYFNEFRQLSIRNEDFVASSFASLLPVFAHQAS